MLRNPACASIVVAALIRNNFARAFVDCKPLMIPKEPTSPMQRLLTPPPPTPLGK
jgi:hypothetical protein